MTWRTRDLTDTAPPIEGMTLEPWPGDISLPAGNYLICGKQYKLEAGTYCISLSQKTGSPEILKLSDL